MKTSKKEKKSKSSAIVVVKPTAIDAALAKIAGKKEVTVS